MIEVLVWLLISTSDGSYNRGNVAVVERFKNKEQCEHVRANIPEKHSQGSICIQANIYIKD